MSTEFFDEEAASSYDQRFSRLQQLKDALNLLSRVALAGLPEQARLLCVGAGTGAELLYLASEFADWTFTVIEPSQPMMELCRAKARRAGIEHRCHFHPGYLSSLEGDQLHHGATSHLVSHFLTDPRNRVRFYRDIADNLVQGGVLISADLCCVGSTQAGMMKLWEDMLVYAGMDPSGLDQYREDLRGGVSLLPVAQMEEIFGEAGFQDIILMLRLFLIQAWIARKGDTQES